ncbi:hypothetical protein PMAYCL1PPCAC_32735, partial [Pristionchus mayeri]
IPGGLGVHQNANVRAIKIRNPPPARNLTVMPLPFYDAIYELLEPQELPSSDNFKSKFKVGVYCQLALSPEQHAKLSTDEALFPRVEVQLRFFNTTGDIRDIEQEDAFPPKCAVTLNDLPVTLPDVIPTERGVERKRPSRPVNITQLVANSPRDKPLRIRIKWKADERKWAVAVYLVECVNAEILSNRIVKSPAFELPYVTTEDIIRKRLNGDDDDDISMDSIKISLLCPLTKTRMSIPTRSRDCTHVQCFDLDAFLMMNQQKPSWKCVVCTNPAPYHRLIIDKYFMKMLEDLRSTITDVELLKDGSYRAIKE